ncbi:hypothetical protein [Alteromonas antoniana]|uniref:hypothetical protein n=1 Tax=Alteromonas antoniana TaxID=2803813 RepID=UPI001C45E28C|nr:hypothetical protein [Alteromonas antoniana]
MDYDKYFKPLRAIHSANFNTCFYCGCDATAQDYIPPISFIHEYTNSRSVADFIKVPACNECFDMVKFQRGSNLAERIDAAKHAIAKKYAKAIRVYEMWKLSELEEMDENFQSSLKGGLSLGEEATERLNFKGFDYEVDGEVNRVGPSETKKISVYEREFLDFKTALDHASETSRIPKHKLRELYYQNGRSFEKAIKSFHDMLENEEFEKQLKKLCIEFSKKHTQNSKFVIRTVRKLMNADKQLTINDALAKLYTLYVKT